MRSFDVPPLGIIPMRCNMHVGEGSGACTDCLGCHEHNMDRSDLAREREDREKCAVADASAQMYAQIFCDEIAYCLDGRDGLTVNAEMPNVEELGVTQSDRQRASAFADELTRGTFFDDRGESPEECSVCAVIDEKLRIADVSSRAAERVNTIAHQPLAQDLLALSCATVRGATYAQRAFLRTTHNILMQNGGHSHGSDFMGVGHLRNREELIPALEQMGSLVDSYADEPEVAIVLAEAMNALAAECMKGGKKVHANYYYFMKSLIIATAFGTTLRRQAQEGVVGVMWVVGHGTKCVGCSEYIKIAAISPQTGISYFHDPAKVTALLMRNYADYLEGDAISVSRYSVYDGDVILRDIAQEESLLQAIDHQILGGKRKKHLSSRRKQLGDVAHLLVHSLAQSGNAPQGEFDNQQFVKAFGVPLALRRDGLPIGDSGGAHLSLFQGRDGSSVGGDLPDDAMATLQSVRDVITSSQETSKTMRRRATKQARRERRHKQKRDEANNTHCKHRKHKAPRKRSRRY